MSTAAQTRAYVVDGPAGHSPAREIVELRVPQEKLNGSEVLCTSIDQRRLGSTHRMRSVRRRINTDFLDPVIYDARVLAGAKVRRRMNPAGEEE